MKVNTVIKPDAATGQELADFIDESELRRRLPVSRRTLLTWRQTGKLPFVRLGGRRILFHWESVKSALLRFQRNGGDQ